MKKLHHIGYVVEDIDDFKKSFPSMSTIAVVNDPVQHARIELLAPDQGSYIELIEPASPDAFTWNFLKKKGQGPHHICYEGYSQDELNSLFLEKKMIKLRGPIPAVLFDRQVIFAMSRTKCIIEFIL